MNHNDDVFKRFVQDVCFILKEEAISAKNECISDKDDYNLGNLSAWRAVLALLQNQADAFGIPRSDLYLENIDPEKDLI